MKKLIPVLLSLLMALTMTATALAATVYTEGALHYTIADESITITGYFGKDAAVTVPASIAGIPVNTIAKGAFTGNDNVKTVDLPDTITAVEEGAFAMASSISRRFRSSSSGKSLWSICRCMGITWRRTWGPLSSKARRSQLLSLMRFNIVLCSL